jgi:uridine kinase
LDDIKKHPSVVISGTIFSDRELFEPLLNMAIFISTPVDICAERVRAREHTRWGERILPGGDMYKATRFHGDFDNYLSNAQNYETADVSRFGRKLHEQWIADLTCPVLRVDGTVDLTINADLVTAQFIEIT